MTLLKSLLVLASLFIGLTANAAAKTNPLQRVCYDIYPSAPADYFGVTVTTPKNDEIPTCWFGAAGIGSQALLDFLNLNSPEAITAFKNSPGNVPQSCFGGVLIHGTINGRTVALCQFSDGSVISYTTLNDGYLHPNNSVLADALKNASSVNAQRR